MKKFDEFIHMNPSIFHPVAIQHFDSTIKKSRIGFIDGALILYDSILNSETVSLIEKTNDDGVIRGYKSMYFVPIPVVMISVYRIYILCLYSLSFD